MIPYVIEKMKGERKKSGRRGGGEGKERERESERERGAARVD